MNELGIINQNDQKLSAGQARAKERAANLAQIIVLIRKMYVLCNRTASDESIALISETLNNDGYTLAEVKQAVETLSRKRTTLLGLPQIVETITEYKAEIEQRARIERAEQAKIQEAKEQAEWKNRPTDPAIKAMFEKWRERRNRG